MDGEREGKGRSRENGRGMEGRGGESKGRDGEMRRQGERGEIASWVQGIDARLTAVN